MTNGAAQACGSEAENERDTESKLVLPVVMSLGGLTGSMDGRWEEFTKRECGK